MNIFLSNHLEVLYEKLKRALFGPETSPFMRRCVVVYGPAMKTWLTLRMAQDPDLGVSMGIEWIYHGQAFEQLLLINPEKKNQPLGHFPTSLELSLAIEKELMQVICNYSFLSIGEKKEWEPLIDYLKCQGSYSEEHPVSRKIEKRLVALSQQLGSLFLEYGRFAPRMVEKWEKGAVAGWQQNLWRRLFCGSMGWNYPSRALLQKTSFMEQQGDLFRAKAPLSIHFFSISFSTSSEFFYLNCLAKHVPVFYYLLSPCAVFWSDIRSDKELAYLQNRWQQRLGQFSPQVQALEEFLRERNPLLANFGRIGREMAYQIDESQAVTDAHYLLLSHVQEMGSALFSYDDIDFIDTTQSLTLLHALQTDLLIMRNPLENQPIQIEDETTITLHIVPNKRREIEVLYHNILHLIKLDRALFPGDFIIMAPQIADYVPYIQSIFGAESSQLDFQVLDLGLQTQSELVQGFLQLLELSESRWTADSLLQLFGHISFQRRQKMSAGDFLLIQEWVELAGIRWGENWLHRNIILWKNHCEQGMGDETSIGTWEYGLSRLLMGLTTSLQHVQPIPAIEVPPCFGVDFTDAELMGKWIRLLHALRDDLSPFEDRTKMTMEDWARYLMTLLESYFQPDYEDLKSIDEYDVLKSQFSALQSSSKFFKETKYSFESVKTHLHSLLLHRGTIYREEHLQSVRFCSLVPLRSIPAKVIAIMGLQEGVFPRQNHHSSLNLMAGNREVAYSPSLTDYDRYLFLEAIHSAQQTLILSYPCYSELDGKELQPSLIVEELFSYLDQAYQIKGRKVSKCCIHKHPFDSFDAHYFLEKTSLHNFSMQDYHLAQSYYQKAKSDFHSFIKSFSVQEILPTKKCIIDIRHLIAAARNPIKFHLNKVLEIYLQTEEMRTLKLEEELVISALDKFQMKHLALKEPLNRVFYFAEREGKLPFGLFKTVAMQRFEDEVEDEHTRLALHGIDPATFFKIEFCISCQAPRKITQDHWLFPAIVLSDEEGNEVTLVGTLKQLSAKGMVVLSRGTLSEAWKNWPQFLLYCCAAKMLSEISQEFWLEQLVFSHTSRPKKAFFDLPYKFLREFINYYYLCLKNFSPLLPDWLPLILSGDDRGLDELLCKLHNDALIMPKNHEARWILGVHDLPKADEMIKEWQPIAERVVGEMQVHWFPSKESGHEKII